MPKKPITVIFVTGDRGWTNTGLVVDVLRSHPPICLVLQGGAPGADTIARLRALGCGHQPMTMEANWTTYGRKAGPIRNRAMGKVLVALKGSGAVIHAYAFHNDLTTSRGTKDMTTVLDSANIPWEHIHE